MRKKVAWCLASAVAIASLSYLGWSYKQYTDDRSTLLFRPKLDYSVSETLPYDALRVRVVEPIHDQTGALTINYEIDNTSSNTVNLSQYNFKVVTNGTFPSSDIHFGTPSYVLPHSRVDGWYVVDPWDAVGYSGPVALLVSRSDRVVKEIVISQ